MTETRDVEITIGVVARARIPELDALADTLCALAGPASREVLLAIETPQMVEPVEKPDERGRAGVRILQLPQGRGLGYNRNRLAQAARGDVIVGVDDDCVPDSDWLAVLTAALADPAVDAVVGRTRIPPSTWLGDSISALGFPAGGNAGYEVMFHVEPDGATDNLASGNCAVRTAVLRDVGGFDESMMWGGEDTDISRRLLLAGKRIVYVPEAVLAHPARARLGGFVRWQFVRGRAKRQFALTTPIAGYVTARLASHRRILRAHLSDPKLVLIAPLLALSLLVQGAGYAVEVLRPRRTAGPPS
jgi:GT2 family glycosyltransferase